MHWRIECRGISVSGSGITLCCNYNDCRVVRVPGGCGGGIPAFPGEPFYGSLNPPGNENSGGGGSTTVDNDAPGTGNNVVGVSGDCITKAEPKLNSLTNEFLSQLNIELPCSNQDIADIMQDVLDENCQEVNTFDFISFRSVKEDFENALEGVETVDPSGLEGCAAYKCAYDLLNNSNNALFCETIGLFDGNGLHHLKFEVGTNISFPYQTWNPINKTSTIKLPGHRCDVNIIKAASDLLHEAIHSMLFLYISQDGNDPYDVSLYSEYWRHEAYKHSESQNLSVGDVQHYVMVYNDYYVRKLSEALWQMNNQEFSIDHYMHIAWEGLRDYSEQFNPPNEYGNPHYISLHQEMISSNHISCQ
jgi:hypothetical protein